ncbi:MAG: polysaccharide pyruvyl transferase family protein [Kiritimatiellae bacterium]|nr:polysaccharide pyruvyl transferase family protein [Kiritimatiellia bacterium]
MNGAANNILILGGHTRFNCGDRAIRTAILDQLRAEDPSARFHIVTREPARDEAEWQAHAIAGGTPELLRKSAFLRNLGLLIWGGGHLLQDDSSKVKNMYWALVLNLLRLRTRCPMVGYGVGVGPGDSAWGRFFAARALAPLDAFAARDERSADLVRQWTRGRLPVRVLPDPAVDLRPAPRAEAAAYLEREHGVPLSGDEVRIGISLRRWFHVGRPFLPLQWRHRWKSGAPAAPPLFEQFGRNLAGALNRLAAGRRIRLLFFPMSCSPWEGDDAVCAELQREVAAPSHLVKPDIPAPLLKALFGLCDLFVGVRLHATILALGMNVPMLNIAYVRRASDLFARLGLPDQSLPIEEAAAPGGEARLLDALTRLYEGRREIGGAQARAWAPLAAECRAGYARFIQEILAGKP